MSQYTSGPWQGMMARDDETFIILDADNSIVADVVVNGDLSETEANARLIIAAPCMLAALKQVVSYAEETSQISNDGDKLRDLLMVIRDTASLAIFKAGNSKPMIEKIK